MGKDAKGKSRLDYVKLSAAASGRGIIATARDMKATRDKFGVTFREYYERKFYSISYTQKARESKKTAGNHRRRAEALKQTMAASGMTEKQLTERVKELSARSEYKLNLHWFNRLEMYKLDERQTDEVLAMLSRRLHLGDSLRKKFRAIDHSDPLLHSTPKALEGSDSPVSPGRRNEWYETAYADTIAEYEEFRDITSRLMTDTIRAELKDALEPSRPDLFGDAGDPEALEDALLDMETSRVLLGFNLVEYVMFDLIHKSLPEKREFITEPERAVVLDTVNDMSQADNLDDKYKTYCFLKEYYGRDMILIESEKDLPAFRTFCENNPTFVRKLFYDSMGRGVQPITVGDDVDGLFRRLLAEEPDGFIAEGLIRSHESLKALNPDSVNTARLITYWNGKDMFVYKPFMKIGQKGSFVDNGGAGGIFTAINAEKGFFESNGIDEKGRRYDSHPYTGVTFEGFQLPDWDQALELGRKICDKIPGFRFIGWDLAYTEEGKWIIVEGNSITQFLGQQSTRNLGAKKHLLNTVDYKGEL